VRTWGLSIACACGLAYAEPPREADSYLERGKHLYEIQDYDGAIAEYQAGYLVEQRAEFLYGIGQAYRMKGDCERANRSYNEVLRAPDGGALRDAARKNIDRCRSAPPPQPQLASPPPPPPPSPPREAPAWYSDTLGGALVLGGIALGGGGAIAWKIGRDEADRTYGTGSYNAWYASSRQASHADTLQSFGITAVAVGGTAVLAGIVRYVWPEHRGGDALAISFAF
jgi:tetratricopeptide (TPR) repeat protein